MMSFHLSATRKEKGAHHSMPMKLTNGALLQVLLSSSNVMALRQVLHDLLTNPTSREDLGLRVREPPLKIWNCSSICGLLAKIVRVVEVDLMIGSTYIRLAQVGVTQMVNAARQKP